MEATYSLALQFPSWIACERFRRKQNSFIEFNKRCKVEGMIQANRSGNVPGNRVSLQQRRSYLRVSDACKDSQVTALQSGNLCTSFDGNWLLKTKGQEVGSCLKGCCVFLVGMMGSGKTTVGKILSESLSYAFVDSDKYVEEVLGGISVAQIFQKYGENFFRDMESEALHKLSLMPQQVVATGGGAVVRPSNWKCMKQGITVFLDVPLDALARRIAAVGTDSRPLLQFDSGDPYTKTFMGLFTLSKKRVQAYSDADLTISILDLANNLGVEDVSDVRPAAIALEVLVQIQNYLQADDSKIIQKYS